MQSPATPPPDAASLQGLARLSKFDLYQQANEHIFPSLASLRWFYRAHREELLRCGAVIELAGRLVVDDAVFARKALEIGQRVAASRAPGGD